MEDKRYDLGNPVRSRCNKLREVLKNAVAKGNTKETNVERYERKFLDNCNNNTIQNIENRCEEIKVKETYDTILDLRNAFHVNEPTKGNRKDRTENKISNEEQIFLDKVCKFPNMHYKLMTLCSVKNSSMFTEQFNTKTNIISERIVNKQLELQTIEKPPTKPKPTCKILPRNGEKIVIQKILEKEKELQQNRLPKKTPRTVKSKSETKISRNKVRNIPNTKSDIESRSENKPKVQTAKPRFQLSTKPDNTSETRKGWDTFKPKTRKNANTTNTISRVTPNGRATNLENSSLETKKSNISRSDARFSRTSSFDRCRPRFLLSTKLTKRCAVSHSSVQVTMKKSFTCIQTQTENVTRLRSIPAQTRKKNITNAKKMQTRLCKTHTAETSPAFMENPSKCTGTPCDYYCTEHQTQMYEHLTTSDLVCLDWVNKHLFGVTVNPHKIIVGDKIREVSEMASKSTFLSGIECFPLPR